MGWPGPKNLKRGKKQQRNLDSLKKALRLLVEGEKLPAKFKDHALGGQWKDFSDCHIEPDWVLICQIQADELHLVRIGSHADLFE
ncbi:MAG: type II toxin-antitoxin system YafQ family toxin [Phycisphaerae bacterium]|nr:type II toxin-antitoxin system YafQ family toxin [Phycisphaerae bacterium]